MKALSVRAPFWWAILHLGKDIENRDWPTRFRGTVYIHASKWWSTPGVIDDWDSVAACYKAAGGASFDPGITFRDIKNAGGCIVGSVEIVDCVSESSSPWFFGEYGFVLDNPRALPKPIPCRGALGFFDVPDGLINLLSRI
jgi:hypothetical protein